MKDQLLKAKQNVENSYSVSFTWFSIKESCSISAFNGKVKLYLEKVIPKEEAAAFIRYESNIQFIRGMLIRERDRSLR